MGARESIENLWDRAIPIGPLLDRFAHELAEEIRNNPYKKWGNEDRFYTGVTMAADLIDPEVNDG